MRMVATLVMVAGALTAPTAASAHKDLAGDVHPKIRVADGRFVVTFRNNVEDRTYETVVRQPARSS